MWFQYLIQLRSLSTSTDKWSSINNECNILSTPFPLLQGNNLQLSEIVFFSWLDSTFISNYFITFYTCHRHGFVIPRCGYFIKFGLFSSPKGRQFDQKIAKFQMPHPCPYPPSPSKHWYVHYLRYLLYSFASFPRDLSTPMFHRNEVGIVPRFPPNIRSGLSTTIQVVGKNF